MADFTASGVSYAGKALAAVSQTVWDAVGLAEQVRHARNFTQREQGLIFKPYQITACTLKFLRESFYIFLRTRSCIIIEAHVLYSQTLE